MPYYRLYHLHEHNGHIVGADEIDAADDVAAVASARALQQDTPAELWQEGRKVHRLDYSPMAPARRVSSRKSAIPLPRDASPPRAG